MRRRSRLRRALRPMQSRVRSRRLHRTKAFSILFERPGEIRAVFFPPSSLLRIRISFRCERASEVQSKIGQSEKHESHAERWNKNPGSNSRNADKTDDPTAHFGRLHAGVYELRNFLRPNEKPNEIEKRNEMKADGAGRRNRMFVAGDARKNLVVIVNADEPVDTRNEGGKKHLKRWNDKARAFEKIRIARHGDSLSQKGRKREQIADPEFRHARTGQPGGGIGRLVVDVGHVSHA